MYRSRKSAVFKVKQLISPFIPAKAGIQKAIDWVPAFAGTNGLWLVLAIATGIAIANPAHAQDVRGLEVCTAEKQMDRRTSCLQANVNFLQDLIDRNARDARQKLDAAAKELAAARNEVAAMKASLAALQARLEKLEKAEKNGKPNDAQKK